MTKSTKLIAWGVLLPSLVIALFYTIGTKCFMVYDAVRDYNLYNLYRVNPAWHPVDGVNGLQNTALFSSYFPAIIQHSLHLPVDLFFKVYTAAGIALVPVLAFLIAYKIISRWYAVFSAVYLMGWVAFYQGGSYARLNFAVVLFELIVLVYLSKMTHNRKIVMASVLALLLPLAHYGTAIVSLVILSGVLAAELLWKRWREALAISAVMFSLLLSFIVWQVVINHNVWENVQSLIGDTTIMANTGANNVNRIAGVVTSVTGNSTPVIADPMLNVASRDKITQAAFGSANPGNANVFHFNAPLLFFAWLTVMLTLYGCWVVFRGKYSLELKAVLVMMLVVIGVTVLSPQVSRGYGIEKTYYQAITITGVAIVVAGEKIAGRIKKPVWAVLGTILVPYVLLMWQYGQIVSIRG